jgi:hypothetical protein
MVYTFLFPFRLCTFLLRTGHSEYYNMESLETQFLCLLEVAGVYLLRTVSFICDFSKVILQSVNSLLYRVIEISLLYICGQLVT